MIMEVKTIFFFLFLFFAGQKFLESEDVQILKFEYRIEYSDLVLCFQSNTLSD